jgi:hypothetical protein
MSPRPAQWGRLAAILGALTLLVAACSNASPAATSAGSSPAAATPAATTQATVVLPSGLVIPSFNADVDLEAKLPSDFCGQKTTKASFSGSEFLASDATFSALVQELGRSPADVSVAGASVPGPDCVGINLFALRIKGADTSKFEQLFLAVQAKNSKPTTKTNVGGKDVWTYTDDSGVNYLYFKDDIAFGVTADTAADAAKGVAVMP